MGVIQKIQDFDSEEPVFTSSWIIEFKLTLIKAECHTSSPLRSRTHSFSHIHNILWKWSMNNSKRRCPHRGFHCRKIKPQIPPPPLPWYLLFNCDSLIQLCICLFIWHSLDPANTRTIPVEYICLCKQQLNLDQLISMFVQLKWRYIYAVLKKMLYP